ncbi:beta-glucosidase [Virgisporangium aliadipatigenens]|uniref:Beta-glucosidase n=1 Tax=Virgisporangium aliadipatigenens TaxID=741659 RepID=A0A8J3YQ60_9ACTN|nr:GH1 family beta-glucosidase [Virgisporangium aliadipatigenens]GIJ47783.1 beta-glucosidase [Virgisporangium aliadipatigenens]
MVSRRRLLGGAAATAALAACDDAPAPSPAASAAASGVPRAFRWGAATSAFQVEGATAEDSRGTSIWDTFTRSPGKIRGGDNADVSADHYHRWAGDLDLARDLGLTSYRFSVAWPRIQPDGRGPANQKGLDFYKRLVGGLRERGISPVVTLYHWDLPQALQDQGGWENRDSAQWFGDYAEIVFRALGDATPTWLTINEPKTIVQLGYADGVHPPAKRDRAAAQAVMHHLNLAHGTAVRRLRAALPGQRIGPALNLSPVVHDGNADPAQVTAADIFENRRFLDPLFKGAYPSGVEAPVRDGDLALISAPNDVLAVQYYNPATLGGKKFPTSQATWEQIYPQGMYDLLVRLKRDYGDIPLMITENGAPFPDTLEGDRVHDPQRTAYIRDHIAAMKKAIAEGVNVEAYHVWSLLDNFEWTEGYGQRWGIVYVDYPTQRRILKDSALWYRDMIAGRAV